MLKFIVLIVLASTVYCLPVDNTINNSDTIDNNNEKALAARLEETTTNAQLFNNNDSLEDEKLFKQMSDDDLVELSNLTPESKQSTGGGGLPNLQSLIDQTNTILSNIDIMIADMEKNKKSTTL